LLQRTRISHLQNDLMSDASRLLGLEGLGVQRVESDAFGGRVVNVVTADETASACPSCGVLSVTLKGRGGPHRARDHPAARYRYPSRGRVSVAALVSLQSLTGWCRQASRRCSHATQNMRHGQVNLLGERPMFAESKADEWLLGELNPFR
jgi:hypothetical protein